MIIVILSVLLLIKNILASFDNYLRSWIWLNNQIILGKEVKAVFLF